MGWIKRTYEKFKYAHTVEEIEVLENKLSYLFIGILYSIASIAYIALFSFVSAPFLEKVLGTLAFLVCAIVAFRLYYLEINARLGSVFLAIFALIPFIYTLVTSYKTLGFTLIFSYWLVLLLIAYFRSEYIYISSVFGVTSIVAFDFFKGMSSFSFIISAIPAILIWLILLIVSFSIVNINRLKVLTTLEHIKTITDKNNSIKAFSVDLKNQNNILEEKHTEILMLNKELDETNKNLTEKNRLLQGKQEELRLLAYYDKLTHIPNRQTFLDKLQASIDIDIAKCKCIAVILIDIDNFMQINDAVGDEVGDEIIISLSNRLSLAFKEEDFIGRIGGDVFGVITCLSIPPETFIYKMLRTKIDIEKKFDYEDMDILFRTSLGVAFYPQYGKSAQELFKCAENALSEAKQMGRNRLVVYNDELKIDMRRKYDIVSHFKFAFKNDEFSLVFQPVVNLSDNKIMGCEALIRWQSDALGFVGPNEFIPVAEASGAIYDIGAWVFDRACYYLKDMNSKIKDDIRVSVNISLYELATSGFVERVKYTVDKFNVSPKSIIFELTESVLIKMTDEILGKIKALQGMGFMIAIDDFGSGYFSFDYFLQLDIDFLKMDKSLTDNLLNQETNGSILIHMLINLSKKMGSRVLCEGVEEQRQFEYLKEINCDYAQGYYMSKPISYPSLLTFIQEYNHTTNTPL